VKVDFLSAPQTAKKTEFFNTIISYLPLDGRSDEWQKRAPKGRSPNKEAAVSSNLPLTGRYSAHC